MTLGFAMAAWPEGQDPLVGVVADSRLMQDGTTLSDAGIKTYELGGRSAMVAAGYALPTLISSEFVRPFVENHNRKNAKPLASSPFSCEGRLEIPRRNVRLPLPGFLNLGGRA